jgi:hypothetical protein
MGALFNFAATLSAACDRMEGRIKNKEEENNYKRNVQEQEDTIHFKGPYDMEETNTCAKQTMVSRTCWLPQSTSV